ncbi:hypothetical protein BDZ91DRAFT_779806 [Kalaharituber pfeilii]|nr:hypothetical protein BDZ91DRAFT_779806 [Kalaharituber pfeilii]
MTFFGFHRKGSNHWRKPNSRDRKLTGRHRSQPAQSSSSYRRYRSQNPGVYDTSNWLTNASTTSSITVSSLINPSYIPSTTASERGTSVRSVSPCRKSQRIAVPNSDSRDGWEWVSNPSRRSTRSDFGSDFQHADADPTSGRPELKAEFPDIAAADEVMDINTDDRYQGSDSNRTPRPSSPSKREVDNPPKPLSSFRITDMDCEPDGALNTELRFMLASVSDQLETARNQNKIMKTYHESELARLKTQFTAKRAALEKRLSNERKSLAKEKEELKRVMQEIMDGLDIQEGFERKQETEIEVKEAEEMLRKPKGEYVHVAVVGLAGGGKSSFVNSIRGLSPGSRDGEVQIAPVGALADGEKAELGLYPHRHHSWYQHIIWYDVPAPVKHSVSMPPWDYFNSEGLFAFDALVLIVGDSGRLCEIEAAVLQQARGRKKPIPVFLVKMKADEGIRGVMSDVLQRQTDNNDKNELQKRQGGLDEAWRLAAVMYAEATKERVQAGLQRYRGLDPEKRVYIVSKEALAEVSRLRSEAGLMAPVDEIPRTVDEEDLWRDIMRTLSRVWRKRCEETGKPVPGSALDQLMSTRALADWRVGSRPDADGGEVSEDAFSTRSRNNSFSEETESFVLVSAEEAAGEAPSPGRRSTALFSYLWERMHMRIFDNTQI